MVPLLFICLTGLGQSNRSAADSIRQLLEESILTDSQRIRVLREAIANELNPQNDILYADEIIKLAGDQGFIPDIHYAFMSQANAYKILGNNVTALDLYFQAAEFF